MNTDKNILIAEFCGFQKTDIGWYDAEEILNIKGSNTFDELLFDTDANWLLPVAKLITNTFPEYDDEKVIEHILNVATTFDLEYLYIAVVEFVEWYNEKNLINN